MKTKKIIFSVVALVVFGLLAVVSASASGSSEKAVSKKVNLVIVSRAWAKDQINWATEQLKKKHPDLDINVNVSLYEYDQTRQQLAIKLSRKEAIDVMTIDHIWLGQFKDLIRPMNQSDISIYNDFIPAYRTLMNSYAPAGKTMGMYGTTDVRLLFWNKDLMKKVGIDNVQINTWDDVKNYAKRVKANIGNLPSGVSPVGFMAGGSEHTNSRWYDYLWTAKGDILSKDFSRATFNQQPGVDALEFYGWFLKNGMTLPAATLSPANGEVYDQAFLNGNFVISLGNGQWLGTTTAANVGLNKEQFLNKFGAALIPAPASGGQRGATVAGGYVWSVSKFSKNPELAKEFIELITGPHGYNVAGTGKTGIPTVTSALSTIDDLPDAALVKSALKQAHFRPTTPSYPKIAQVIRDAIQDYVENYQTKTAKAVLDDAATKVDSILNQ